MRLSCCNRSLLFLILFRHARYSAYRPFIRRGYRASISLNLKAKAESNRQPYLQANWPIANMRRIRPRLKNPPEDRVQGTIARVFALMSMLDFPCQSTKSAHSHVSARYLKALTAFDNTTFLLLLQIVSGSLIT